MIFLNLNDVHHDPKYWNDEPQIFKPERFLSKDERGVLKLIKNDALMPFGSGMSIFKNT